MTGSKKWFVYTTDQGNDFAILADESNTEALNAATQDYVSGTTVVNAIPRNIKPRAVVYGNADKTQTVRCYALTQTIYNAAITTVPTIPNPNGSGTLAIIRLEPERIQILPTAFDTGLQDGDAT